MDPVFPLRTVHDDPPVVDTSIRYPTIRAPPSSDGGAQDSRIWDSPDATALRLVGARGTPMSVVALATLDGSPVPSELIADTR